MAEGHINFLMHRRNIVPLKNHIIYLVVIPLLFLSVSHSADANNKKKYDCWVHLQEATKYRSEKKFKLSLYYINKHDSCDLAHKPTSRMSYFFNLGLTLYEMGEFKDAIEAFTSGLETQPEYTGAHYYRGLSLEAIGDTTNALIDFSNAYKYGHKANSTKFVNWLKEHPEHSKKIKPL